MNKRGCYTVSANVMLSTHLSALHDTVRCALCYRKNKGSPLVPGCNSNGEGGKMEMMATDKQTASKTSVLDKDKKTWPKSTDKELFARSQICNLHLLLKLPMPLCDTSADVRRCCYLTLYSYLVACFPSSQTAHESMHDKCSCI